MHFIVTYRFVFVKEEQTYYLDQVGELWSYPTRIAPKCFHCQQKISDSLLVTSPDFNKKAEDVESIICFHRRCAIEAANQLLSAAVYDFGLHQDEKAEDFPPCQDLSLAQFCEEFDLDLEQAMRELEGED